MTAPIKYFFRRKGIRKYSSKIKADMVPLSSMKKVFILLDSADRDAENCAALANGFFGRSGIKPDIFYIDTRSRSKRKKEKNTDPLVTFTRKDLNWYGRLKKKVLSTILSTPQDLYIDLTSRTDYPVIFLAWAFPAKFKAGCIYTEKSPFNMTVKPAGADEVTSSRMFREITALLMTIK